MKLKDLKSGMLIMTAAGKYGIVMKNVGKGYYDDAIVKPEPGSLCSDTEGFTWFPLDSACYPNGNIHEAVEDGYRIVKVYSYSNNNKACSCSAQDRAVLFDVSEDSKTVSLSNSWAIGKMGEDSGSVLFKSGKHDRRAVLIADLRSLKSIIQSIKSATSTPKKVTLFESNLFNGTDGSPEITVNFESRKIKVGCSIFTFDDLDTAIDFAKNP